MNGKLMKLDMTKEYLEITHGEGVYLYDRSGKKYLDGISGVGVTCLGYGNEELAQTLKDQAMKVPYVHAMRFNNTPILKLTEKLTEIAPYDLNWAFFVSGGSEANESAVKLVRQYHLERGKESKYKIIGRMQSFHGNTLGGLAIGGHAARRKRYQPLLVDLPHIVPPYCYRCPYGREYPGCGLACADALEEKILEEGPDTCAAFIMEPIVGAAAGCIGGPKGYMKRIREICDKYDMLLIADEVICGFGRTGTMFCVEQEGVAPDIITFAKGISSGYAPLGGMLFSDKVGSVFKNGFEHNFTFAGNPLCCSVGLKTIEILQRDHIVEQVPAKGEQLFALLHEEIEEFPFIGDIRGRGLFAGIEIVRDKATKEPFAPAQQAQKVMERFCLEEGLIIYPCGGTIDGTNGAHFLLMPPLIITMEELDELARKLRRACEKFEEWMKKA